MKLKELLYQWEKKNNPFFPNEMKWDRTTIYRMLDDFETQLVALPQADVSSNEGLQKSKIKKKTEVAVCRCAVPELIIGNYENKVCNLCGELLKAN